MGSAAEFIDTARAIESVIGGGRKAGLQRRRQVRAHRREDRGDLQQHRASRPASSTRPTPSTGTSGSATRATWRSSLATAASPTRSLRLVPLLKRFGLKIVAFTGNPKSDLAHGADHRLFYRVRREACPLKLAPTASTTAALALGDALAMVLLEARGLTRDDFAKYHPAGNLGRVLLLRVRDIMRSGARLPVARETVTVQEAILAMTKAKSGSIAIVGKGGRLTGILTDGDFRRSALTGPGFLGKPVTAFMTPLPQGDPRGRPGSRRAAPLRRPQDRRPDRRGLRRAGPSGSSTGRIFRSSRWCEAAPANRHHRDGGVRRVAPQHGGQARGAGPRPPRVRLRSRVADAFEAEQQSWRFAAARRPGVPGLPRHARGLPRRPGLRGDADAHPAARGDARGGHLVRNPGLRREAPHPRPRGAGPHDRGRRAARGTPRSSASTSSSRKAGWRSRRGCSPGNSGRSAAGP